jgi:YHYH protein
LLATATGTVAFTIAQQPPPPRMHSVTEKGTLKIRPAESTPEVKSEVSIEIVGDQRVIKANGIPNHMTGVFPNPGNPNRIAAKASTYSIPAKPEIAENATPMHGMFGVAINGVPFDPGAGEFYAGEPGWQYEPLSGAIDLGIDVSHAHVQPGGKYHYHGLPTGLLDAVMLESGKHSPLIGWAADGFPMYAVYGYSDPKDAKSEVQKLSSSYQLKKGDRPGGNAPGGKYDGTFVRDYEYVAGSGDLDECCGRFTVTPEFPEGTYAYFMTEEWPVVPRMYRGTPSVDFSHGPGSGGPGGGGPGGGRVPGSQGDRQGTRGEQGPGGMGRPGGPPRPGQLLPDFLRQQLDLNDEQQKQVTELQEMVDEQLKEILTEEQLEQLNAPPPFRGRR